MNDEIREAQASFLSVEEHDLLALRIIETNEQEREDLLKPKGKTGSLHQKPASILENLRQLAPGLASLFSLKSEVLDQITFRLIIDGQACTSPTSYSALSYCWRRPDNVALAPKDDLPNHAPFPLPVSRPMFGAILSQRDTTDEGIWIDQICINQDDEAEKAILIGAMDSIYRNARKVIIAIEDIFLSQDEVTSLRTYMFEYIGFRKVPDKHPDQGLHPPFIEQNPWVLAFLDKIFSSAWFERAWCGHEMRLAQEHVFLIRCSQQASSRDLEVFRFTSAFLLHLLHLHSEVSSFHRMHQEKKTALLQFFGRQVLNRERDAALALYPTMDVPKIPATLIFTVMVAEVFNTKAGGNPKLPSELRILDANRDRVSITLNNIGYGLMLSPREAHHARTTREQCFAMLLLLGLAAQDPFVLCTTGPPLLTNGITSWLCTPTQLDIVSAGKLPILPDLETSSQFTLAPDMSKISLSVIFPFGKTSLSSLRNTKYHLDAERFIDLAMTHAVPGQSWWTSWSTNPSHPRFHSLRQCFIRTLACCLQCGYQWFIDVSTRFQSTPRLSEGAFFIIFEVDSRMSGCRLKQAVNIKDRSVQVAATILVNLLCVVVGYGIPWSSPSNEMDMEPVALRRSGSDMGRALVFFPSPERHGLHDSTIHLAIPAALKSREYDCLSRGWLLEARRTDDGSTERRMAKKALVFGNTRFWEKLENAIGEWITVSGPGNVDARSVE